MDYLLSLDIGTSGIKVLAYTKDHQTLGTAYRSLSLTKSGGHATQDSPLVLDKIVAAIKEMSSIHGPDITGITIGNAMHGLILIDDNDEALTSSITWADQRASAFAKSLRSTSLGNQFFKISGTPIHAMSPLTKIMWLNEHQPELIGRTSYFADIKSVLLQRLTGEWVLDYSTASATGMFDTKKLVWSDEIISHLSISIDQLPRPISGTKQLRILPEVADQLGLSDGAVIFPGGSDGCLANLGTNILNLGEAALTIGTSGAIRTTLPHWQVAEKGNLFTYYLDEHMYIMGGPSNNGGILLDWFVKTYAAESSIGALFESIDDSPEDVLFLPWMLGERSPHWNDEVRFGFLEEPTQQPVEKLFKGVLQGILYNMKWIMEELESDDRQINKIAISGGLSSNSVFCQLAADILGKPIERNDQKDSSIMGALKMGFKSLGWIEDYRQWPADQQGDNFEPRQGHCIIHQRNYQEFRNAYFAGIEPKL